MIEHISTKMLMLLLAVCFGLVIGNFCTTLFYRLPRGLAINGRELAPSCSYCAHKLRFFEYLPVLSWISTLGRCRYCKAQITFFYTFLELACAVFAVKIYIVWGIGEIFFLLNTIFASILLNFCFALIKYPYLVTNEFAGASGEKAPSEHESGKGKTFYRLFDAKGGREDASQVHVVYPLLGLFTFVIAAIFGTLINLSTLNWLLRLLVVMMGYLALLNSFAHNASLLYFQEKLMQNAWQINKIKNNAKIKSNNRRNSSLLTNSSLIEWLKSALKFKIKWSSLYASIKSKVLAIIAKCYIFLYVEMHLNRINWLFFIFILAPACVLLDIGLLISFIVMIIVLNLTLQGCFSWRKRLNKGGAAAAVAAGGRAEEEASLLSEVESQESMRSRAGGFFYGEYCDFYGISLNSYSLNLILLIIYIYRKYGY